jgi:hypothetical protein
MEQNKFDGMHDDFLLFQKKQRECFEDALTEINENEFKIRRLESKVASLRETLKIVKGMALRLEMDIMRNEFSNLQDLCVEIKQAIAEEEAS